MKPRIHSCFLAATFLLGLLTTGLTAQALSIVAKERVALDVVGRIQLLGHAEKLTDPSRQDVRLYLFLRQARLGLAGRYRQTKFRLQLAFAGEEEVRAPSPGVSLNLLDLYAELPLFEIIRVRVGQFKVPFGREQLVDSGALPFAGRSIQYLGFRTGRDIGLAMHSQLGPVVGGFGVFAGGGRDVPERFLPEDLGTPMLVGRLGYNHHLDQDVFTLGRAENDENDGPGFAAYLNGMYMKDSLVGHSTVLNVRLADKSLLINSNWNPFIKTAPLVKGTYWQIGGDWALRIPVGETTLHVEGEVDHGRYSNVYGAVNLTGARAQLGAARGPWEAHLRYVVLRPDGRFANAGVAITGTDWIHEITPSVTLHLKRAHAKVILDAPVWLNAPVAIEPAVGAYATLEQPDQVTVLDPKTGGSADRQTVAALRLLFQYHF